MNPILASAKLSKLSDMSASHIRTKYSSLEKAKSPRTPSRSRRAVLAIFILSLLVLSQPGRSKPLGDQIITYLEKSHHDVVTGPREVHFVPHSHIDPVWFTTYEVALNYYAYPIYTSVIQALNDNGRFSFTMSETCFIKDYLNIAQKKFTKPFLKYLRNGRIEVQGGGLVMHDEACPYPDDMIMNLSYGRLYLQSLGVKLPTVVWMIDTFGHGVTNMRLHSQMGYKDMVSARMSDDIRVVLKRNVDFLFEWVLASNPKYHLKFHQLGEFYVPLKPFNTIESWDGIKLQEFPISDITNPNFDLSWKVLRFTSEIKRFESGSASNYILSPFGGDDNYRNAPATFGLLSSIVIYMKCNKERIGLDPKISSLKEYFKRLEQENLTLSKVTQDFFPVVDDYGKRGQNHTSWTGYYTTNPELKHRSDSFMRNLRFMHSLVALNILKDPRNDKFKQMHSQLEEFIMFSSLLVHHDTITGTSKDATLEAMFDKIREHSGKMANIILDSLLAKVPEAKVTKLERQN